MRTENGKLTWGENLTDGDGMVHDLLRGTFVGQAHLAGTGPEGKTCRECKFFYRVSEYGERKPPEYYVGNRQLKPQRCNYAIPNKSKRMFPHRAKACRFFEQAENPPPAHNPTPEKK